MIRHIYLIGTATLFLVIQMSSANALELKLTPPFINLANEDTSFTIAIVIENVSNLGAFEFKIIYDPAIVTVKDPSDVMLGDFLGSTGRSTGALGPNINNGAGSVSFGAYSLGDNPGPNGHGTLCTINFLLQEKSSGVLALLDVETVDIEGEILKVDATENSILLNEIYVDPERECGGKSPCRDTINEAISDATSGSIIKIAKGTYNENPALTSKKLLIFQGGWDGTFTSQTPQATFIKSPQVITGSVTFQNLVIIP